MSNTIQINNPQYTANKALASAAQDATLVTSNFVDLALLRALEIAGKSDISGDVGVHNEMSPQLTAPKLNVDKKNLSAIMILTEVQHIIGNTASQSLEVRLKAAKELADAKYQGAIKLGEAFAQSVVRLDSAKEKHESNTVNLSNATENKKKIEQQLHSAENNLLSAEQIYKAALLAKEAAELAYSKLTPQDPEFDTAQKKLAEASVSLKRADEEQQKSQVKVAELKAQLNKAKTELTSAEKLVSQSLDIVNAELTMQANLSMELDPKVNFDQKENIEKARSSVVELNKIMAELQELISENTEKEMREKIELSKKQLEQSQKELKKKSEEYDAEVRKAAEVNRTMGCISKIVGALLTVVGVVTAAFTGGASLALAGVGVALFAIDNIMEAAGTKSLSQMVMEPIMSAIINGLKDVVSWMANNILGGSQAAHIIAAVLTAAILVAITIAVAIFAKPLLAKMADKLGSVISKALPKLVPALNNLGKNGLKQLSKNTPKFIKSATSTVKAGSHKLSKIAEDSTKITTYLNRVKTSSTVLNIGHEYAQGGMGVYKGFIQNDQLKLDADMKQLLSTSKLLRDWIKKVSEGVSSVTDVGEQMAKIVSDNFQSHMQSSALVARKLKA